jgi:predicted DNA-binding transcriptional regulator YafY
VPRRARSQEVIRQWRLLRQLWESKYGRTVKDLADEFDVGARTIHRDIVALQEAGFPLEPGTRGDRRIWTLNRDAFQSLVAAGLTIPELCALYFSRTLLEYLAGTFFQKDLQSAFDKFEDCFTGEQMKYLDDFPKVLMAKSEPRKKGTRDLPSHVSRLISAALDSRPVTLVYDSKSSRKVKTYAVEPYTVVYGRGGMYLLAFVPAYGAVRLFAMERLKSMTVGEGRFTPRATAVEAAQSLADSLGINLGGRPESVAIEFLPDAAPYVEEREWHPSQTIERRADGSVVLRMKVVVDWGLMAWVLGFGARARVVSPRRLARQVYEHVQEMHELYAPKIPLDDAPAPSRSAQEGLPFAAKPR